MTVNHGPLHEVIVSRFPREVGTASGAIRSLQRALTRACRATGTMYYSPHDLRHRYISLLVAAGTPVTIVQVVAGHAKASVTLDVYSHVLVDESPHRLAALRAAAERAVGASGAAPVIGSHEPDATGVRETTRYAPLPD